MFSESTWLLLFNRVQCHKKNFFLCSRLYPQPIVFSGVLEHGNRELELAWSVAFTSQVVLSPVVVGQCCLFSPWFLAVRLQMI